MSDYIDLCYSDDKGHNFSFWQARLLGETGNFNLRKIWRRLGMTRDRRFKIRVSAFRRVDIIGAQAQINHEG